MMKSGWVAAYRRTKDMPNVYSLKELQDMARKKGIEYAGIKKKKLAKELGIKWVDAPKTAKKEPKKKIVENPIYIAGKGCNTGNYPKALSKEMVARLAMEHLGYTKSQTLTKTKDEMCAKLALVKGIELPPEVKKTKLKKKTTKTKKTRTKKEEKLEALKKEEALRLAKDLQEEAKKKKITPPKKSSLDSGCIDQSKLKLHPYQRTAVNHIRTHRGAVLAFEVGAGKTLTAVAAAQCAIADGMVDDIVVVAPPQLLNNMMDTLDKFGVSSRDKRKYSFFSIPMFAKTFRGTQISSFPKRAMLIVDEAHKLKKNLNPSQSYGRVEKETTAARVAIECAKKAVKVVLLTGTPVSNHPVDVVNLAAMVRGENELTENQFNDLVSKPKVFDEYMRCIFEFYENPKSDDYPSKKVHVVNLEMDKNYYRKYMQVEKKELDAKGMTSKTGELKAAFYSNIRQATNSFKPNPKIDEAMKIIKKGKKTLVYSAYKDSGVNILKVELKKAGIKFVSIDGSMTVPKREDAKDKFNNPSSGYNVMLITQAASVGLDLKGVRNVILLEKGWKSSDEEQIIGRAVRYKSHAHLPEQERKVDVWHLVLKKPSLKKRMEYNGKEDLNPSADEILENKIKEKDEENIPFERRLRETAIGKRKNCEQVPKLKILEELNKGKGVKLGSKVKYLG